MTASVTVLSGPSGVGKGTVVAALLREHPEIWVSTSVTTRPPRPGEVHGVSYYFVTEAEFDDLVATDALLEWAVVHGRHRYGTPRLGVEQAVASGRCVLLELDLSGARQVRVALPSARQVFLLPPTREELERRLRGRATETAEAVARRLRTADEELAAASEFDVSVVNVDVADTVRQLVQLLGLGPGQSGPPATSQSEGTQ